MTTQKEAMAVLRLARMSFAKYVTGEYRVTFREERGDVAENSAYYTTDIDDAVVTGLQMRARRDFPKEVTALPADRMAVYFTRANVLRIWTADNLVEDVSCSFAEALKMIADSKIHQDLIFEHDHEGAGGIQ